jgi:MFS family permease
METVNNTLTIPVLAGKKWLVFSLCMAAYIFCGTVSTLMSVYLPVAIPELLKDSLNGAAISEARLGEIGAYVNATFLYGWMLGGLIFGVLSDRIGRVKALALVTLLYGVGTLLVVFVTDYYTLMFLRFITGMGVGGVLLIATVYISEIWDERTRPVMLGILAVSFPVGIVATGSLNIMFSAWRQAFGLGVIPITLSVLIFFLATESHQWKLSKSAFFEKKQNIFEGANRANLITGSLIFGSVLIGLWGIFSWLPTWVQTLLHVGEDGQRERGLTMILLGMGGITGGVFSGFLIRNFGSRKTLIFTFLGCIVMCCILFLTNKHFSPIVYFEMAILSLFFGVSQGSLSSYIPELFPVVIRATATGFCFNIGRFFTATAVFFIGTLVTLLGGFGNALVVFSIPFTIAFVTTWYSKEVQKKKIIG